MVFCIIYQGIILTQAQIFKIRIPPPHSNVAFEGQVMWGSYTTGMYKYHCTFLHNNVPHIVTIQYNNVMKTKGKQM